MSANLEADLRESIDMSRNRFHLSQIVVTCDEMEAVLDALDSARSTPNIDVNDIWVLGPMKLTDCSMTVKTGTFRVGAIPKWWKVREWLAIYRWLVRCRDNPHSLTFDRARPPFVDIGDAAATGGASFNVDHDGPPLSAGG